MALRSALVLLLTLSAVTTGCRRGSSSTVVAGRAVLGTHSLAMIPADTPYVFVSLSPMSAAYRDRVWAPGKQDIYDAIAKADDGSDTPGARMAAQLLRELQDGDRLRDLRELGFSDSGRFVFYGLSLWPVLRLEIADGKVLRGVTARVLGAVGPDVKTHTHDGMTYWVAGTAAVSVIVAVLDREAVISLVPTPAVDKALPLLLGTERPARSLAQTVTLDEVARRHDLLQSWLGYVDLRAAVRVLLEDGTGLAAELAAPWRRSWGGALSACGADLQQIARVFPQLVFGYQRLDERGFRGGFYLDSPTDVGASLARLRTSIPTLAPADDHPLMAMAIAADIDGLLAWLRDTTATLRAHPFQCPALAELNQAVDNAATQLQTPMPPMLAGLRGVSAVLDDFVKDPPDGKGAIVVVSNQAPALVSALWSIPLFASTPPPALGIPVPLPVAQLGLRGIDSAHLALGSNRIALAVGPGSMERTRRALSSPEIAHPPLATFSMDVMRARERGIAKDDDARLSSVATIVFTLDASKHGVVFGFEGTWAAARAR